MILVGQIITSLLLAIAAIGVGGVLLGGLAILMQFMSKKEIAILVGGAVFLIGIASAIYKAVFA